VEMQEAETSKWVRVGQFDDDGIAKGNISASFGKIIKLRLKVEADSPNWVIISEVC